MCDGLPFQKRQKQVQKTEKQNKKASKNKQQLVEKAIPNIADAIKTVVSRSENEDFRTKCFNLHKIKDEKGFYEELTKKLWKIASYRLNISLKPAAENESQIVPEDEAKNRELSELATKKNAVDKEGGEDYFDDLAGEITFYNRDNCLSVGHEVSETKDASSPEQDSSFEQLAELYWDSDHLSEELLPGIHAQDSPNNHLPDHAEACHKTPCVSASKETLYQRTSNPARETQCPEQQGRESCTLTKEVTDLTPKAKLRCCKDATKPTEATASSNGWLQELSQDCYCSKILCVSASQGTSYQDSVDLARETQCPEQQGTDGCTLTKEVIDLTSPKAKLRCCKDASEVPTEAATSSNDWLQEFSQNCYWVANNNIHEQQEAKQSLPTLNATLQACSEAFLSDVSLSQTVKDADDFDALAELSLI